MSVSVRDEASSSSSSGTPTPAATTAAATARDAVLGAYPSRLDDIDAYLDFKAMQSACGEARDRLYRKAHERVVAAGIEIKFQSFKKTMAQIVSEQVAARKAVIGKGGNMVAARKLAKGLKRIAAAVKRDREAKK
jgi:hypothetical protein